jgi:hypothetical protein
MLPVPILSHLANGRHATVLDGMRWRVMGRITMLANSALRLIVIDELR